MSLKSRGSTSSSKSKKRDRRDEDDHDRGSNKRRKSGKTKGLNDAMVKTIKHYDAFYNQAPPGLIQEDQERPEDCIPDLPENQKARQFLANAPTKGLWMPLGREVKVMKCWRCKTYGHRTGDKECPMFISGNAQSEQFRSSHEDPMHDFIENKKKNESLERVRQLQLLLEESSSESGSSSSDSGSSNSSSSDDRRRSKQKTKRSKKRSKHKKAKKSHKNRK